MSRRLTSLDIPVSSLSVLLFFFSRFLFNCFPSTYLRASCLPLSAWELKSKEPSVNMNKLEKETTKPKSKVHQDDASRSEQEKGSSRTTAAPPSGRSEPFRLERQYDSVGALTTRSRPRQRCRSRARQRAGRQMTAGH